MPCDVGAPPRGDFMSCADFVSWVGGCTLVMSYIQSQGCQPGREVCGREGIFKHLQPVQGVPSSPLQVVFCCHPEHNTILEQNQWVNNSKSSVILKIAKQFRCQQILPSGCCVLWALGSRAVRQHNDS